MDLNIHVFSLIIKDKETKRLLLVGLIECFKSNLTFRSVRFQTVERQKIFGSLFKRSISKNSFYRDCLRISRNCSIALPLVIEVRKKRELENFIPRMFLKIDIRQEAPLRIFKIGTIYIVYFRNFQWKFIFLKLHITTYGSLRAFPMVNSLVSFKLGRFRKMPPPQKYP